MASLREVQEGLRRALLERDASAILPHIVDDQIPAGARLQIYQNHVRITLTEALKASYPVVCRLVDERFFAYACSVYIAEHPPEGPCLFEYGDTLPEFLERFPPCRGLPWLGDVARFERAINAVLNADDAPSLDPAALAAVPVEHHGRLVLRFHPACRLLISRFPIDHIWQAGQPGAEGKSVDPCEGEVMLEVRRLGDEVVFRRLDPPAFVFCYVLRAGGTLERAASAALRTDPGFDLVGALGAPLGEGVLTSFTLFPAMPLERPQ
jgi:hypothetical protein